ncbi:tyrosine-type recombinase/integrase [Saccharopolyspora spinosa]|uniref:Phage integrase family protein n=2 Tax=Saccharopolyspora spinosa TaxID=60894 RepID=A0A2N3Y6Z0_SACSN|nr:tyrosine-type recombinase/integrase [Saccharopolyspora spinosa]PKW18677.1 phage integrase family protein [Saccharopolyspora spinosa]
MHVLHRLIEPIEQATPHWPEKTTARVRSTLLRRVHHEQLPYWAWDEQTWINLAKEAGRGSDLGYRGLVVAIANALGLHRRLHHHVNVLQVPVAELVFGVEPVQAAITDVVDTLRSWDASKHTVTGQIPAALSDLLLVTGTARLEDIAEEDVRALAQQYPKSNRRSGLIKVSRVLAHKGIITQPLHNNDAQRGPRADTLATVPPQWLAWAQRWRQLSTHEPGTVRGMFSVILIAGRWAAEKHPEALEPCLWTRDIAAEYVADTLHAVHGQWAGHNRNTSKKGQPLSAVGKVQRIDSLRAFFLDLIDWEWIKPKFDPRKVLAGPLSVRAQIGPNPRIIDEVSWAKLMAAGLTLNIEDVNEYGTPRAKAASDGRRSYYPIEMVRALVGVWLFAGCRIDEIRRLDVDCIQRDEGRDEQTGEPFPICLLRVPQNKTTGEFTKPVDPIVGQLVEAWQHVRPPQPDIEDRKTGQRRQFLFCVRGQLIGRSYLNDTVLPALCRKAGIPETDSRGALTSHRARSTIATQLLNAPEPLSIVDLKEWLGHKHFSSTRHYAAILQRKLTSAYKKADYFARNVRTIQVLIDRESILTGAATSGEQPWKYYDLGDGYCTYDFFAKCPHRLACARCPFYLPKESSAGRLLEVKDGVENMLERLDLTDDERTALEGDRDALAGLANRLAKVPTPAGPTPEELGTDRAFIALTAVQNSITGAKP